MDKLGHYITNERNTNHFEVLRVFSEPGPTSGLPEQLDALERGWQQLTDLEAKEWIEGVIPRPYGFFAEDLMQAEQVRSCRPFSSPSHPALRCFLVVGADNETATD